MANPNIGQRDSDFAASIKSRFASQQSQMDTLRSQVAPTAAGSSIRDNADLGDRNKDFAAAVNARFSDQQEQLDILNWIVTGNMPGAITYTVDLSTLNGITIRDGVWDKNNRAIKA